MRPRLTSSGCRSTGKCPCRAPRLFLALARPSQKWTRMGKKHQETTDIKWQPRWDRQQRHQRQQRQQHHQHQQHQQQCHPCLPRSPKCPPEARSPPRSSMHRACCPGSCTIRCSYHPREADQQPRSYQPRPREVGRQPRSYHHREADRSRRQPGRRARYGLPTSDLGRIYVPIRSLSTSLAREPVTIKFCCVYQGDTSRVRHTSVVDGAIIKARHHRLEAVWKYRVRNIIMTQHTQTNPPPFKA